VSLWCHCCGRLAFGPEALVYDGDPVPCGCPCWVSCDAETPAYIAGAEDPCPVCEQEAIRDVWVDGPDSEAGRAAQGDFVRRRAGCLCQWEEGDSPCPVHGDGSGLERDLNEALRGCEGPPGDDGDDVPF